MSTTTPELTQLLAERERLDALILEAQSQPAERRIELPAITLDLRAGERYAGAVLNDSGEILHHLVLLPDESEERLSWDAAMNWAKGLGADLPTRQEQALLFANCKASLKPAWHWSNQTHEEDASFAWYCFFFDGNQFYDRKSYEACVRAVRRIR